MRSAYFVSEKYCLACGQRIVDAAARVAATRSFPTPRRELSYSLDRGPIRGIAGLIRNTGVSVVRLCAHAPMERRNSCRNGTPRGAFLTAGRLVIMALFSRIAAAWPQFSGILRSDLRVD